MLSGTNLAVQLRYAIASRCRAKIFGYDPLHAWDFNATRGAMDAQIAQIAAQIARQEAFQSLHFWLVLAAIAVACGVISLFLFRYADKVADVKAQTDKLPEMQKQLAAQIRIAEVMKAETDQKRWGERERLVLFRTRLEELLTATYQVSEEASRLYSAASSEEKIYRNESAENRLKTIAAFYFPELNVQVSNIVVLGTKVEATAMRVNDQWRSYKLKRTSASSEEERAISKEYIEAIAASSATMQGYYKDLLTAVKTLERNAVPMIAQYVP